MCKSEKAAIYFKSIADNDIIRIRICELNDNIVCPLSKTTNNVLMNQYTCQLIDIHDEPANINIYIRNIEQLINSNVVDDKCTEQLRKNNTLDYRLTSCSCKNDCLNNELNGNVKSDINVILQVPEGNNSNDVSNCKGVKITLDSQEIVDDYVTYYSLETKNDKSENMSGINRNNSLHRVKNINDLKRVIPKVKILGAEVNTLKELTQGVSNNNKFNIMEGKTIRVSDSREKLNNYCRTCAGLKIPLVDIFSDKGVQMRLNQQMKHLENIDQHDSLSTHMCMDCICDLKMSYKFFMQIKKAEVKLKSIHTSVNASLNASLNVTASVRVVQNQSNVQTENSTDNLNKSDNIRKCSNQINQQQSLSSNINCTNTEDACDDNNQETSKQFMVESINNWSDTKHDSNDDAGSIEEFDPDDHPLESIEYKNINAESDIEINKENDKMKMNFSHNEGIIATCSNSQKYSEINDNNIKENTRNDIINECNFNTSSCIKMECKDIVNNSCSPSHTITERDDITTKETVKQPNILKRKPSWHGKSTNVPTTPDLKAKEAKIHKLNTVSISPSDEEGIMYVTVKGSKPNELLLVKVKKMDKSNDKKDEKNSIKKSIDVKPIEKISNTTYCDRSKNLENRGAIIEEQIEQYKKKREKVLGSGINTNTNTAATIITVPSPAVAPSITLNACETVEYDNDTPSYVNINDNFMENFSLKVESESSNDEQKDNIQVENEYQIENSNDNDHDILKYDIEDNDNEHNSTNDYLARLTIIKQKWEEAKVKKELLQKQLDDSYVKGNLEKLSRILGEKEKNLQEFQEYLKQRKIVITRLKDEDIISLYEDRNIASMHNKLPDLIDENPILYNIGDNFLDCDYCPEIFSTRGILEEHLKSHDYKIHFYCEDCGSEFPNNKAKRTHNITCLKKLICKYCDFMLESKGKKRQHEQKHCDAIYGQLCDVCGEKFKHQGTLDQHIKTQHMNWEKVFQCPKCPKKFAFKQKLSFHLKSVHTTLRAYLCEDCGADFKNPASLRHHRIRKHHPTSNKRECPVCRKLVPFYSLSKHMYTHKAYTIECPHCEKMFKNTSTLKQHVRIHEDQRQYRCDTCGVGFNRRDGLRLHMRVHQKSDSRGLKECSCQICSEKFPNHSMLVIHRNRVHKDGRQYTCHICNRSMLSTRSLEWHMSHIHNETPTGITPDDSEMSIEMKRVACSHCDKTFKTEMILRTHIKNTHMEKNPVKCSDCDLMFTSEVRLRHHMMIIHNRLEGTLTCPHCPKRFVNQLRLKTHMISHSEERPYTCEICGFNLKTKIQLIKHHQNRHSDERPLQCRYCPWRCKQVSALVCHERTHTNERPYSCTVCKQRFKYLGDKNKHERRHESLGGSGFKRIVAGRNIKHPKNHNVEITATEHDLSEHDYEAIDDDTLTERHVDYDIKYDDENQIDKFELQEIDDDEQQGQDIKDERTRHLHELQDIDERNSDEEDDEDGEGGNYEEDEEEEEEEEEDDDDEDDEDVGEMGVIGEIDEIEDEEGVVMVVGQQQQTESETVIDDEEYKQVYDHEYDVIPRETSETTEVIMNMEDATVYTEEVTADNIENAEMLTAEMMTNEILQTGTVVHIEQQDDDGKIQVIPVMLSLPDLTDSTAEINLTTGSIMYNN